MILDQACFILMPEEVEKSDNIGPPDLTSFWKRQEKMESDWERKDKQGEKNSSD